MARAPMQILLLPYRKIEAELEYLIFFRSDAKFWQGIAGGGEDDETPEQAVKREAFEEAKIDPKLKFLPLDSFATVPAYIFKTWKQWPEKTFAIPEHYFTVELPIDFNVVLSEEHLEYKWCSYNVALELLKWQSNKNALWELDHRLKSKLI